jgi:HPt (histidine-containing phosphotransfer) domain-containing protein
VNHVNSHTDMTENQKTMTHPIASQPSTESLSKDMLNVEELCNRCMGSKDLVRRVLQKFQHRIPEELAEMEQALERGDAEQVARIAHRVRGASANVSAARLAQAALEIEETSRAEQRAGARVSLDRIRQEWAEHIDYITMLLSADIV